MRLRALCTVVAAAVAVAGLTGCESKVGVAAVVDGHRISDSELAGYVTRTGPVQDAPADAQSVGPKVIALNALVQQQVFTAILRQAGGVPSESTLAGLHDEALQRLLNSSVVGDAFDKQLLSRIGDLGYEEKFVPVFLRTLELEDALVNKTKATGTTDLAAKLAKYPVSVSISGRYGTWDESSLGIDTTSGAGLPDFVTFGSDATADATS